MEQFTGIEEFIIGTPGQKPRFILSATRANALLQVRDGEVCFTQVNAPTYNHRINDEGTALIDDPLTAEEIESASWVDIKIKRNDLLDEYRWTWMPDSQLSNKDAWLAWGVALQRLTVDFAHSADVVWPTMPGYEY